MAQWTLDGRFLCCVFQDGLQLAQQRKPGTRADEVLNHPSVLAAGAVQLVGVVLVFGHGVVDGNGQRIGLRSAQLGGLFLHVGRQALADIGRKLGQHVGQRLNC
ncbi:hypothetical protein D3C76_1490390 [compost metagenome]